MMYKCSIMVCIRGSHSPQCRQQHSSEITRSSISSTNHNKSHYPHKKHRSPADTAFCELARQAGSQSASQATTCLYLRVYMVVGGELLTGARFTAIVYVIRKELN